MAGKARNLVEGPRELSYGLDQRRARQGPLSRLAPQARGLLDQPSLGAVTRQQLGLAFGNVSETGSQVFQQCEHAVRVAARAAVCRKLRPEPGHA